MNYNEANKTHHGIDSRENIHEVTMYAKPRDVNCPVAIFELYLSKLISNCESLFQQPLQYVKSNCWYAVQGISKCKIWQMMYVLDRHIRKKCFLHHLKDQIP